MSRIKIVVPSFNRAASVLTHRAVSVDAICVPESQAAAYREQNYGCEIVTHPDEMRGMPFKRQFICDRFGDVFQVDDDIVNFIRMYNPVWRKDMKLTAEEARDAIQGVYEVATDMGAYLFGVCPHADVRQFQPMQPFRVTGHINGAAFGLRAGSKIKTDPRAKCVVDHVLTGLNAFHHRYLWRDDRFGIQQKDTFVARGGLAGIRTSETEQQDCELLQKMFGEAMRFEIRKRGKLGGRSRSPFPRVMDIPF